MIKPDENLHEQLLIAIKAYYKSNHLWRTKGTYEGAKRLRKRLATIINLCTARKQAVSDWVAISKMESKIASHKKLTAEASDTK